RAAASAAASAAEAPGRCPMWTRRRSAVGSARSSREVLSIIRERKQRIISQRGGGSRVRPGEAGGVPRVAAFDASTTIAANEMGCGRRCGTVNYRPWDNGARGSGGRWADSGHGRASGRGAYRGPESAADARRGAVPRSESAPRDGVNDAVVLEVDAEVRVVPARDRRLADRAVAPRGRAEV